MAYGAASSPQSEMASRISYVIGEDGRIQQAYPKVSPKTHPEELLQTL